MTRGDAIQEARQRTSALALGMRLLMAGVLPRDSIADLATLADRTGRFLEVVGVD